MSLLIRPSYKKVPDEFTDKTYKKLDTLEKIYIHEDLTSSCNKVVLIDQSRLMVH